MDAAKQLEVLENAPDSVHFGRKVEGGLRAAALEVLQINLGRRCNLSCKHCHVHAGPDRSEVMSRQYLETCLEVVEGCSEIAAVDLTGGSPEMNPNLGWFVEALADLGRRVMVRSNLAILMEPEYARFADIYAACGVEVVSSLPAYQEGQVNRQRGDNVYERIIAAMRILNQKGYGKPGSGLVLNLVHNPVGAYLPGAQGALEQEYRRRLHQDHGLVFNNLFCLTNCPVGRYLEFLLRSQNYENYMRALIRAFNHEAVDRVMCRSTVSVGWDGTLYDCDFNQMLGLPVGFGAPDHIARFDPDKLRNRQIVLGNHCFSCTAGAGSSCQGALE